MEGIIKINIHISVQDEGESGNSFASRLEKECNTLLKVAIENSNNIHTRLIEESAQLQMTTASNGRQTATFSFKTKK